MASRRVDPVQLKEWPAARWVFGSRWASVIWLVARVWLGYEWLRAGLDKIWGPDAAGFWNGGGAVKGFAAGAIAQSHGPHAQVAYGWWAQFLGDFVLPNHAWIAKVVAVSEVTLGVALIAGLFTGIAAFGGLLLNFTYLMSGTVAANPMFVLVGVLLILAWRNAGYLGVDGILLPGLGTPWQRGSLTRLLPQRRPRPSTTHGRAA